MEEIVPKNKIFLNMKSKGQLYFGQHFSKKIQDLKIFIYGLKGVNKYLHYYSNVMI